MLVSCLQGHLMQRWHQLLVDKVDNSGKLRRQMEKHGALSPAHAAEVLGLGRRGGRQEGGQGRQRRPERARGVQQGRALRARGPAARRARRRRPRLLPAPGRRPGEPVLSPAPPRCRFLDVAQVRLFWPWPPRQLLDVTRVRLLRPCAPCTVLHDVSLLPPWASLPACHALVVLLCPSSPVCAETIAMNDSLSILR